MQRGTMRVRLLVASRERALPSERLYCLTFKNVQNVCKTRDAHRNLSWVGRFSFLLDGNPENQSINESTKTGEKAPHLHTPVSAPLQDIKKRVGAERGGGVGIVFLERRGYLGRTQCV